MKTKAVIEIVAAVVVSIIVLAVAFQYQRHPGSNSQPSSNNNTLTNNTTMTKNQTNVVPVSANNTQSIPHIGQFITSDYASKQIPDSIFKENRTVILNDTTPSFIYLKYNGSMTLRNSLNTSAEYPSFLGYPADPSTGSVNYAAGAGEPIIFNYDDQHGKMFVHSTEDRFVWTFATDNTWRAWTSAYVDARSGQFIGYYNPCADYKPLLKDFPCPT